MSIKSDAFSGCFKHGAFDYYCHACLVATVATLCGLLDQRLGEEPDGAYPQAMDRQGDA